MTKDNIELAAVTIVSMLVAYVSVSIASRNLCDTGERPISAHIIRAFEDIPFRTVRLADGSAVRVWAMTGDEIFAHREKINIIDPAAETRE